MSSMNLAIIVGNVGKDPEIRYLPSGDAVANFSVATSETWKDKATGEKKEQTEWHRCNCFGRTAEIVGQYIQKGSKVAIQGRITTRKWTDKDGVERYSTEIKVDTLKMLGGPKEAGEPFEPRYPEPANRQPSDGGLGNLSVDIPF